VHGFAEREILLIVQVITATSRRAGTRRSHPRAHLELQRRTLYGVPQLLDEEENLRTLRRLVEHFERHVEEPMLLDPDWGRGVARGTVGIRLAITHFVCKVKLSQDKDP